MVETCEKCNGSGFYTDRLRPAICSCEYGAKIQEDRLKRKEKVSDVESRLVAYKAELEEQKSKIEKIDQATDRRFW